MGFFGGDDDSSPGQSQADELASEQLMQNKAELEAKKQNLYETRIDIIKGQGGQSWVPDRTTRAPINPSAGGAGGGGRGGFPPGFLPPWVRQ